jgi:hypothetical protein
MNFSETESPRNRPEHNKTTLEKNSLFFRKSASAGIHCQIGKIHKDKLPRLGKLLEKSTLLSTGRIQMNMVHLKFQPAYREREVQTVLTGLGNQKQAL